MLDYSMRFIYGSTATSDFQSKIAILNQSFLSYETCVTLTPGDLYIAFNVSTVGTCALMLFRWFFTLVLKSDVWILNFDFLKIIELWFLATNVIYFYNLFN